MTTVAPSCSLGVAGVPVAKVASICCGFRANIGTIRNTSDRLIATPGMGEGFPHPVWLNAIPPSSPPHSRHPRPVVIPAQSGIHRWPPRRSTRPLPCIGLSPPICYGGRAAYRTRIPHLAITNNAIYTGASPKRRCGRVAEGGALLKRYTGKTVSRVRIPPSPPHNYPISLKKRVFRLNSNDARSVRGLRERETVSGRPRRLRWGCQARFRARVSLRRNRRTTWAM